jgi:hypothetical protein
MKRAPHRAPGRVLDSEGKVLQPIRAGEVRIVVAPNSPTRREWLFVEHSVHETVFERVGGLPEYFNISVSRFELFKQQAGGRLDLIKAGAQNE